MKSARNYRIAEDVLPADLYEAVRARLPPKTLLYIRPIGHEMNRGEALLGAALVRRVRQALCLHRTGVTLYVNSIAPVGRPPNRLRAQVNLLAQEEWPPRTIRDALGVSRSVVAKLRDRRGMTNEPRTVPERFSPDLLRRLGTPTREDVMATVAVMLQFHRQTPTGQPDTDVELLKTAVFGDAVPSGDALEALMARVVHAAQARARLRRAGFQPPTTASCMLPAPEIPHEP